MVEPAPQGCTTRQEKRAARTTAWRTRPRTRQKLARWQALPEEGQAAERTLRALAKVPWCLVSAFYEQWDQLKDTVKVFNPETQLLNSDTTVPWPVVFVLGLRGEKCVLGGGRFPGVHNLLKPLQDLEHRLFTAQVMDGNSRDQPWEPKLYARNDTWRPPQDAALRNSLNTLRAKLLRRYWDFANKDENLAKVRGNVTPLDKLGLRLLRDRGLSAVRADKDKHFVCVTLQDLTELKRQVLHNLDEVVPFEETQDTWTTLRNRYLALCERLASRPGGGGVRLFRYLTQGCTRQVYSLYRYTLVEPAPRAVARVELNLKTHKRPVQPRELENNQSSYLRTGQTFVSVQVQKVLTERFPWVLKDSRAFVQGVAQGRYLVPRGYRLWAADVKRFYPSCHQNKLGDSHYQACNDQDSNNLCRFLLHHQLLEADGVPGVYRRWKGAGMGTCFGGELCDLHVALFNDVALLTRVAEGRLLWYARFRDDGLFCAPDSFTEEDAEELARDFARRGSNLVLELQRYEREAAWLDLVLTPHTHLSPRLHLKVHLKDTNAGLYLEARSYHARAALSKWTEAELRRYARNSTDLEDCLTVTRRLELCLKRRGYPADWRDLCGRAEVLWRLRTPWLHRPPALPDLRRTAPLVLKYHRVWEHLRLASLLHDWQQELDQHFAREGPKLLVAYKNNTCHLYVKVRRLALA